MRPTTLLTALLCLILAAPAARAQTVSANECANATVISGTGTFNFSTQGATRSTVPAMFNGCIQPNYDVWARWTAPQTGWLTLNTCVGTTSSVNFAVYQGGDCANLLPIACGERLIGCPNFTSAASFWVDQGQVYTFRLDKNPGVGQFSLTYSEPFPGDDCHNALHIAGAGVFPFDNSGATSAYNAADPYVYVNNDVWYRWTAAAGGQTYISTCGHMTIYPAIELFENLCPVGPTSIIFNSAQPGCPGAARIDFTAEAGRTYLLRIGCPNEYARISNGAFEIVQVTGGGGGEVITVTTTDDAVDITGAQNYDSLPGPNGKISFREACIAANNTPGGQRIEFNVPISEWYYPPTTFPYANLINADGSAWLLTDNETVVDGTTQTANVGDTNPNGPEIGFHSWNPNASGSPALIVSGDNCVLNGLGRVYYFGQVVWLDGDNNRLIGSRLSAVQTAVQVRGDGNIIGGTESGEGNDIEGLRIDDTAAGTVIIGNDAVAPILVSGTNTRIGGPTDAERNIIGGAGGFCCEGVPTGSQISLGLGAADTLIENNYIGVDADGVTTLTQVGPYGITISNAANTVVRNNVVSECYTLGQNHYAGQPFGAGITVNSNSSNTLIQGNRIGTNAAGEGNIRNLVGIRVIPDIQNTMFPTGTVIGGDGPGEGNLVANSESTGILVTGAVSGVTISGNAVRDNALLGIDLGNNGVSPNDPGDGDTGPNGLQNFPILASAAASPSSIRIDGALNSTPSQSFTLEFFASPACDPAGHGEGATYLGATPATTDAAGNAPFTVTLPATVPPGAFITATTTASATANTSEFSPCLPATPAAACPADYNDDNAINSNDISSFLTAWLNSIQNGNLNADFNNDLAVNSNDISAFLTAWLDAVQNGC